MALGDILRKVAADFGASDLESNANTRAFLVEKINSAAMEIWSAKDLPGSLREITVSVSPGKVVGLPHFVGALRAMRETDLGRPWVLNDLRPRYHSQTWPTKWNNWRFIGYGATMLEITNQAPVVVTIDKDDSDLVITIVGSTATSLRTTDVITMNASLKNGSISFTKIDSIQANKIPADDVYIVDSEGTTLAVLYADSKETRYILVDVSDYPLSAATADGSWEMDVLYKMKLPIMSANSDIFPVHDYDDIVKVKTMQLLAEGQEGKEQRAAMAYQKAERMMQDKAQDQEGSIQKKIRFEPNPLLGRFSGGKFNVGRRMKVSRYGR